MFSIYHHARYTRVLVSSHDILNNASKNRERGMVNQRGRKKPPKDGGKRKERIIDFVGQRYQSHDQNAGISARNSKGEEDRSFEHGRKQMAQILSRKGKNRKQKRNNRGSSSVKEPTGAFSCLLRLDSCDG